jgi:PAS domain S-box-containing protein
MKSRKTIIRITTWMSVMASLAMMCVLPLGYFVYSYEFIRGSLESEVEINSRLVTELVNNNPALWRFEQLRLDELLAKRPDTGASESRRIVDFQGVAIAGSDNPLPAPQLTVSHDVLDAGLVVARIEISRSLQPLLFRTGLVAFVAFLCGLGFYFALRFLPIQAVIEAENDLRESGEFLARIMQSTTNAIVVIDQSGRISHVNQRCAEISGYTQNELIGKPFALLFGSAGFAAIREQLEDLQKPDTSLLDMEAKWLRKDGGLVPVSWGGASLTRQDGLTSVVFTAEDISKRKQVQEEKEKLIKELQSALAEIQTLRGIIPICSYCKKIRNDEGVWNQLEAYIHAHSRAVFSHGICPECFAKQMAEIDGN